MMNPVKAKRKRRPEMPLWWVWDGDNCWQCRNKTHCNSCGILKKAIKENENLNKKKFGKANGIKKEQNDA